MKTALTVLFVYLVALPLITLGQWIGRGADRLSDWAHKQIVYRSQGL